MVNLRVRFGLVSVHHMRSWRTVSVYKHRTDIEFRGCGLDYIRSVFLCFVVHNSRIPVTTLNHDNTPNGTSLNPQTLTIKEQAQH